MKALIITYYWPPAGGSGVQRWLKFVKYLPELGIEPIVYCPENANYEAVDKSLLDEIPDDVIVLKHPIFEPNSFLKKKKVATAKVSAKPSIIQKGLQYIRGNYFIPDARKFWIAPSIKFLSKYISENKIDVIISTGPPHSIHLIALELKNKFRLKWVADFRDPMSNLFYNNDLLLKKRAVEKLQKLETDILNRADRVVTVSNFLKKEFSKQVKEVSVISNGYDDEVLQNNSVELDSKFSLSHIGLLPHQSNPKILWKILSELVNEVEDFKNDLQINLVGNVSSEVLETISQSNLDSFLNLRDYVTHEKAIELQKKSVVLLLLIPNSRGAKGIVTGKIFEYITSKRPIVAIAPIDGDAAEIIRNTNTGVAIDFENAVTLKSTILELYEKFKEGTLKVSPTNIGKYHRKNLTEKLVKLISKI